MNRNLPLQDEQPSPKEQDTEESSQFEDPHLLISQTQESFTQDTEESVGSIEDYKRLKGL